MGIREVVTHWLHFPGTQLCPIPIITQHHAVLCACVTWTKCWSQTSQGVLRCCKCFPILDPSLYCCRELVPSSRRVGTDNFRSTNSTTNTNELGQFIQQCNKSWKNRLKTIAQCPNTEILRGSKWPNRGVQVKFYSFSASFIMIPKSQFKLTFFLHKQ